MAEPRKGTRHRPDKLRLPLPFEEAVADALKVKPPPTKKRRGTQEGTRPRKAGKEK